MNALRTAGLLGTLLLLGAAPASAQNVVQLPTWSHFSARTTVSVPDRGSVYTGGVNRAASGRNEFGSPLLPYRNRSIGSQRSSTSVWTSVYIHDFEAMDEAVLSQARNGQRSSSAGAPFPAPAAVAGSRLMPPQPQRPRAAGNGREARPAETGPLSKSVAQLKAEHAQKQRARNAQAEDFFERGKSAEAEGRLKAARLFYQQASRRAQGQLKQDILARLDLVDRATVARR